MGFAAASAIFRALPKNPQATAELGGRVRPYRLHDLRTVENVHALDGRGADDLGRELHWSRARDE